MSKMSSNPEVVLRKDIIKEAGQSAAIILNDELWNRVWNRLQPLARYATSAADLPSGCCGLTLYDERGHPIVFLKESKAAPSIRAAQANAN